jgi:DNA-binding LacI/PurR family transcriptional regulator
MLSTKVAEEIRGRISGGNLGPGDCVPSERELSRTMGVSRVTARSGLNRLVREGLLRREPGRGYFLRAEGAAAPGRAGGSALVFAHSRPAEDMGSGEHSRIWAGAREEAARAGRAVMVFPVGGPVVGPAQAAELAGAAAGVICDHGDDGSLRALLDAGLPVVRVHFPFGSGLVDAVTQDNLGGIGAAVEHLAGRGHRRVAFLDVSGRLRAQGEAGTAEQRLAGYLLARVRLGLEEGPGLVVPVGDDAPGALSRVVAAGATAVVCPYGGIWVEAREGVDLPRDFGVVVWRTPRADGDDEWPSHLTWSREQMGREAARRLLLRLERPELEPVGVLIPTRFVDRGTGGRGPGK